MIIFGTRGVTLKTGSGEFTCPQCNSQQPYNWRTVRRFFTLYFIPVIPMDKLGEYVECQNCKGTFRPDVLQYDPQAERNKARAEFADHIKRVSILTALADGDLEDSEEEAIRDVYQGLSGQTIDTATLQREISQARQAQATPAAYAKRMAETLNEHGKEVVVKAALRVAMADGPLNVQEEQALDDLAAGLNMTQAHYRGIMAEMAEE